MERRTIQGVDWKAKTIASGLHNIKKALEILTKNNNIPSYYAYCSDKIFEGNNEVIIKLLEDIKHAHKGFTAKVIPKENKRNKK